MLCCYRHHTLCGNWQNAATQFCTNNHIDHKCLMIIPPLELHPWRRRLPWLRIVASYSITSQKAPEKTNTCALLFTSKPMSAIVRQPLSYGITICADETILHLHTGHFSPQAAAQSAQQHKWMQDLKVVVRSFAMQMTHTNCVEALDVTDEEAKLCLRADVSTLSRFAED